MKITEAEARKLGLQFERGRPPRGRKRQRRSSMMDGACEAHGLPIPVAEYHFHPTRKWAFDWLFEGWLAVEIVGGVWVQGHHSRGKDQIADMEKRNEAQIMGYVVLEFTPQQIDSGEAFAVIKRALLLEDI